MERAEGECVQQLREADHEQGRATMKRKRRRLTAARDTRERTDPELLISRPEKKTHGTSATAPMAQRRLTPSRPNVS